ncbi:hypothetical protein [Aquimarina agarilytica]|uniref:hypothetical protein n=1 Tax=Aquimarina agarilytica TaxID=1087449 RepID=UPI00028A269F|nr:hypothetical protein [Aquimarina agarilytica]
MLKYLKIDTFILLVVAGVLLSCSSSDDSRMAGQESPNKQPPASGVNLELNWSKSIGGSLNDEVKAIVLLDDDYVVLGNTESVDGDVDRVRGTQDFWVIKLNAKGEIIWNNTYGGNDDDRGESIAKTTDGGFIISGYSRSLDDDVSNNEGSYDHWIVKLDAAGDLQWEKSFGFLGDDRAFSVKETPDGGFVTAGFLDVDNYNGPNLKPTKGAKGLKTLHGVGEFWIHKLDREGNKEWEKFFGGSNNDRASDIVVTNDGGFIAVGSTESDDFDINKNNGSYDYWAIKINATGELIWEKTYGGSEIDMANAIIKTADGNYIIVGNSRSSDVDVKENKGNADVWIVKINENGVLLEQFSMGGSDFDNAEAIYETRSGSFLIAGNTRSNDGDIQEAKGGNDYYLAEIDQKLQLQWTATLGGAKLDFAYDVLEDAKNNIIIIGDSESVTDLIDNKGKKDALVISLSK